MVKKIRNFNNKNKIKIRFHPKDDNNYQNKIMKILKNYENKIEIDYDDYHTLISNNYCVLIQNAKIIFDFWNDGLVVFSTEILKSNIFPLEQDFTKFEYIKNLCEYIDKLPNRKYLLKKYYKYIFFYEEIFTNKEYIINLTKKII